jgi:adenosine deaminase
VVSEFIRTLPKVQLHCHLEGTVRPERFRELAAHHGVDIGERGRVPLDQSYAFATFGEFLLLFAAVAKTLRTPEDFAAIARDYAADAVAQGVLYSEIFVSPSVWTYFHPDLDVRATFAAIRAALDDARRQGGLDVAIICDLTRNFGAERALATARTAIALQEFGVVGIGLGGDETKYPPGLFTEAFAEAKRASLHLVAHAGEAAGPASVWEAIDALGVERVGHGVRAREDDRLVDELAARGIALEMCPTSNSLTGAVGPGATHPIAEFDRRGVRCVIDADDPALFGTTLNEEYAAVADLVGEDALPRFVRNAIDASFAPPERKRALHGRLDAFCLETIGDRRTL